MMKKIFNSCLNLFSKAAAAVVLSAVSVATGTISNFGVYEPEMPSVLKQENDNEESE